MGEQPQITLYFPREGNGKPTIYIDSREAANRTGKKIVELLNELGADVITRKLDFGDYLIGENVAVERKTVFDLVGTLTQRFLFDQIYKMKEAYPASIVLLEGYMGVLRRFRRISPESLNGALFAIAQSSIPIVPTIDYKDTATFLVVAAKQLLKNEKGRMVIRHRVKAKKLGDLQLFAVAGLPHVGPALAENLLKHFKTPRRVFTASEEELTQADGIGPQIAKDIIEVLDTPFKVEDEKEGEVDGEDEAAEE
ncbi:MAG: excision repair protein [Thermoproteota archaeon]|nr:excision repair protein [Thermoproteota archaeon]